MGRVAGPADTRRLELRGQAPARSWDRAGPLLVPGARPAHLPPPVGPTDVWPRAVLEQGREGRRCPVTELTGLPANGPAWPRGQPLLTPSPPRLL